MDLKEYEIVSYGFRGVSHKVYSGFLSRPVFLTPFNKPIIVHEKKISKLYKQINVVITNFSIKEGK